MREAYYMALHGNLTVGGIAIPLIYDIAQKGVNPDVYGIISCSSNTSNDTIGTKHNIYVSQLAIVVKNNSIADNVTLDLLGDQFYQVVEPSKGVTGINPDGLKIQYSKMVVDRISPAYVDSSGKIVLERIIQYENRILQ